MGFGSNHLACTLIINNCIIVVMSRMLLFMTLRQRPKHHTQYILSRCILCIETSIGEYLLRRIIRSIYLVRLSPVIAIFAQESYNTDVVFRDTNEVDHDVCSPGKRDEHRRRFESFESWDSASDSCSSRDGALSDGVDEGNMLFMSYEASHELRELRATREVQHYGGMRVFRGLWGMVFYIGPHW